MHVRLSLYKRIAAADSAAGLDELTAEVHRPLRPAAAGGAESAAHRASSNSRARALGVRRLDLGPQGGTRDLRGAGSRIEPATLVRLIQKHAREYRLEGPLKLRVTRQLASEAQRFEFAAELLKRLGEPPRVH